MSSISSSGKNISFPLSPSTGFSLAGFSHLMFLPFLLHLRFFLSIFQIWVLSWAQNSPVYANQPSRLGAAEMCRTSDTPWDSSLVLGAELHYLESYCTAAAKSCSPRSGLQAGKKSLNRKFFLLFVAPPALNLPENTVRTFPWWDNLSLPFWAWLQ